MNTEIILIPTYCNTEIKVSILNDTIDYIRKNYPQLEIAIYAHYPLDFETQKKINYYIYDYTNPVLDIKGVVTWTILYYYKVLKKMFPDYGYAVLQKMVRSLSFLKNLVYRADHTQ